MSIMDDSAKNADLSALKIDRRRSREGSSIGRRLLYVIVFVAVAALVYVGYRVILTGVAPAVQVQTAAVRYLGGSEASAELVATGYVVAQIKAAVSSKATGRLTKLNVEEGDTLLAGDIIAIIENDDMLANVDLAKAQLKQALADSVAAHLNYIRQNKLLEGGHTTEEMVENATANYHSANAYVEAMKANVRAAEVALENTIIRAPFNGTVLTKNADVGEMVAPMASSASSRGAVVTMADMASLEVEADVSESNINKVKVNQPCEIILDAYPDRKYNGYVKKVVPTADRARATVMVKIAFRDKDELVLPEMSARVNFLPVDRDDKKEEDTAVLVVDNDAITMRGGREIVFRYDDGYAREVPIDVGRKLGDVTEVLGGLLSGHRVILNPPGGLSDGDKVKTGT
jgi:RND family efflux transporter MFP subunit